MFTAIKPGIKNTREVKVRVKDTALAYGSGDVDVYATPAMIALMESTANQSLHDYLPDGYVTVGGEINVKHIKATPLAETVVAESELIKVDGKKLVFRVEARDTKGVIGVGEHTRYILDKNKFMASL